MLTRVQSAAVAGARRHRGSVRWEPGLHAACTDSLLEGCRTIIWSSHPRVGLPSLCLYCGLAHCLTGLTSSLAELIKSFKVREVGQISSEHLSTRCEPVPYWAWRRINGSIKTQRGLFFFFFFFPDSAALACKEPFTWLFLFLPRLKSY